MVFADNCNKGKHKMDDNKIPGQKKEGCISLIGKLDGEGLIQAVVMSELLGRPKAKRRRRGR